jgi:predicted nucleic acid-binding protein
VIVVDASAVIEWLLWTSRGIRIDQRLFSKAVTLHAPHLIDVEVAQVLRRYARDGIITVQRGQEAIEDFSDLSLHRYPHDFLMPRVWELRPNLTAYDAVYVALAEVVNAPLVTCDAKIASAPGHHAFVEVI